MIHRSTSRTVVGDGFFNRTPDVPGRVGGEVVLITRAKNLQRS